MTTHVITVVGYGCLIAVLIVLELLARRRGSRIPKMGEWFGYLMRSKTGRLLILLGWAWLGWHFFAR
jgi:hypothetical protein